MGGCSGWRPLLTLSKIWIIWVKHLCDFKSRVWPSYNAALTAKHLSPQRDTNWRGCQALQGDLMEVNLNRPIQISWTPYIISSTSVFQPSPWFMEEILDRDKDISQHKCWVTHFQMADLHSRWHYHRSVTQYILGCWISPRPISLFHEFTLKLGAWPCICDYKTVWLIKKRALTSGLSIFPLLSQYLTLWLLIYHFLCKTNSQCACSHFHRELT